MTADLNQESTAASWLAGIWTYFKLLISYKESEQGRNDSSQIKKNGDSHKPPERR